MSNKQIIGFDSDDTLWETEVIFQRAQIKYLGTIGTIAIQLAPIDTYNIFQIKSLSINCAIFLKIFTVESHII